LVTSSVNPSRATPHWPEIPRSVSITSIDVRAQPSAAAVSARPYWLLAGLGVLADLGHRGLPQVD
jgi:hypothetical protein